MNQSHACNQILHHKSEQGTALFAKHFFFAKLEETRRFCLRFCLVPEIQTGNLNRKAVLQRGPQTN